MSSNLANCLHDGNRDHDGDGDDDHDDDDDDDDADGLPNIFPPVRFPPGGNVT